MVAAKRLFNTVVSICFLLIAHSAYSQIMCDAACELTITFPDGGYIEATDALTITFGENGVLDLGAQGTINVAVQPSSLDFSTGGVLVLTAGESIAFGDGGQLDLGVGGNIDAAAFTLVTTGDVYITAVDGAETIDINGSISANNLVLNAASYGPVLTTDVEITATTADGINISGDSTISSINITENGGLTSTTGSTGSLELETGEIALTTGSTGTIETGEITLSGNATGSGELTVASSGTITVGLTVADAPESTLTDADLYTYLGELGDITLSSDTSIDIIFNADDTGATEPADTSDNLQGIDQSVVEVNSNTGDAEITENIVNELLIDDVLYTSVDGVVFTDPQGRPGRIEYVDGQFVFAADNEQASQSNADSGLGSYSLLSSLINILILLMLRLSQRSYFSSRVS